MLFPKSGSPDLERPSTTERTDHETLLPLTSYPDSQRNDWYSWRSKATPLGLLGALLGPSRRPLTGLS
eukprot:9137184-Pyramimonas_sp.AAC.1